MSRRTQVLIVGAGPAGLTAGNLMSQLGVSVIVLERNPATSDMPKAIMVDDEFFRTLNTLGLAEKLKPHCAYSVGVHFLSPLGFALARVRGFMTPNHFPNRSATSQPVLEQILLERLQSQSNAPVLFEHALDEFVDDGQKIVAKVRTPSGSLTTIEADYLLGCDGAASTVRKQLGIEFDGTTATEQPHIVIDTADDIDGSPYSRFHCWPSRPMNSIPAPYNGRRFEFMLLPGENKETTLSDASLAKLFAPHRDFSKVKIIRRAVYTFHARLVRQMRSGRAFLAGDAAHLMPPFGAQGMNAGARDVTNLVWKLAHVLDGRAGDILLDSYDVERRAHVASVIKLSVRIGHLTNITSRPLALLRDLVFGAAGLIPRVQRYFDEMRYMPRPVLRSPFVVQGSGHAGYVLGRPLPLPLVLDRTGRIRLLDEELGLSFVAVHIDPKRPAELDLSSPAGIRLHHVAVMRAGARLPERDGLVAVSVIDGRFDSVFEEHQGHTALVRPDRYVAAIASSGPAFQQIARAFAERMAPVSSASVQTIQEKANAL